MIYKRVCWIVILAVLSNITSFCFGQLPQGRFFLKRNIGRTTTAINQRVQPQSQSSLITTAALKSNSLLPSIITLPESTGNPDANDNYSPGATSTNLETPITYTSDNPAVGYILNGYLHLIAPGVINITASQAGNANYSAAIPVTKAFVFDFQLRVKLAAFPVKKKCDNDFNSGAVSNDRVNPLTYESSNINVATVNDNGIIHIIGQGSTMITVKQNATFPYYLDAEPQAQFLVVTPFVLPDVRISAFSSPPCGISPVSYASSVQNAGFNPGYQWQVNNVNVGPNSPILTDYAFKDGDKVTCTVINQDNACTADYPVKSSDAIVVLPEETTPTVTIVASANGVFAGTLINFTAAVKNIPGNISYQWYVNGVPTGTDNAGYSSQNFANGDVVTCIVTPATQCALPITSNMITVKIVDKVTVPNTFTPNGDGINDIWNIAGLSNYPNSAVYVYNRYGKAVYQSKGYVTPWNGTAAGKSIPVATYYYIIDLGLNERKLTGQLTILR